MHESPVRLPALVPVMALPGVALFPEALLPLRIFEPRYRQMLAAVLAGDRIFAVGMLRPDAADEEIFPVAGAGLVRACVSQPDGTSELVLQGLARVRFDSFAQTQPYLIGRATEFVTANDNEAECCELIRQIRKFCDTPGAHGAELPEAFHRTVAETSDPAALGDLVARHLVRDPITAQQILAETHLPVRLKVLIAALRDEWQHSGG